MHIIADYIGEAIIKVFNKDYLDNLFSFGITIEDIILQVLFLCCRYAYLKNLETHPLLFYIELDGLEAEPARKESERILKYAKEKFDLANEYLSDDYGAAFRGPDLSLTKKANRFPEYNISKFHYWEIRNIHDMELVKSILEKRITSSKKVSNDQFVSIANEYDNQIEVMKTRLDKDPESAVFSSIQFFTLETKYYFNYLYELSARMEALGQNDFPDMKNRLNITAGCGFFQSLLPVQYPKAVSKGDCIINYPLILQRRRIVNIIPTNEAIGKEALDLVLTTFIDAKVLVNALSSHYFIEKMPLRLYFEKKTELEDWYSVINTYNVFSAYIPNKEWTSHRIKAVRKMYDTVSIDYKKIKNPENRP